jgi:hypothetical protein
MIGSGAALRFDGAGALDALGAFGAPTRGRGSATPRLPASVGDGYTGRAAG